MPRATPPSSTKAKPISIMRVRSVQQGGFLRSAPRLSVWRSRGDASPPGAPPLAAEWGRGEEGEATPSATGTDGGDAGGEESAQASAIGGTAAGSGEKRSVSHDNVDGPACISTPPASSFRLLLLGIAGVAPA